MGFQELSDTIDNLSDKIIKLKEELNPDFMRLIDSLENVGMMNLVTANKLLRESDACDMLCVSRDKLRTYRAKGLIKAYCLPDNEQMRYRMADILALIKEKGRE